MTPILILDFDGVLNYEIYRRQRFRDTPIVIGTEDNIVELLDPACCALVQQICDATGANIVVSSTWRKGRTPERLHAMLSTKGLTAPVVGTTSERDIAIDERPRRAAQIMEYVRENNLKTWLALDDFRMDLPFAHYIQTSDKMGITEWQAKMAIGLLKSMVAK